MGPRGKGRVRDETELWEVERAELGRGFEVGVDFSSNREVSILPRAIGEGFSEPDFTEAFDCKGRNPALVERTKLGGGARVVGDDVGLNGGEG